VGLYVTTVCWTVCEDYVGQYVGLYVRTVCGTVCEDYVGLYVGTVCEDCM